MNEIKCTVENCIHHCDGDCCDAKEITVSTSKKDEDTCKCCQTECDTFTARQ